MTYDPVSAMSAAQRFLGTSQPLKRLGFGVSGTVFLSPDLRTAVKVHHLLEGFETEVTVYNILRQHRLLSLHGLTIPKMIQSDSVRKIIQMDFDSPPFLLDFAGVLFEDPEYTDEVKEIWHREVERRFNENAHIAFAVYHAFLTRFGLYYMDLRPTNIKLDGLPGIPSDIPNHDETWW